MFVLDTFFCCVYSSSAFLRGCFVSSLTCTDLRRVSKHQYQLYYPYYNRNLHISSIAMFESMLLTCLFWTHFSVVCIAVVLFLRGCFVSGLTRTDLRRVSKHQYQLYYPYYNRNLHISSIAMFESMLLTCLFWTHFSVVCIAVVLFLRGCFVSGLTRTG